MARGATRDHIDRVVEASNANQAISISHGWIAVSGLIDQRDPTVPAPPPPPPPAPAATAAVGFTASEIAGAVTGAILGAAALGVAGASAGGRVGGVLGGAAGAASGAAASQLPESPDAYIFDETERARLKVLNRARLARGWAMRKLRGGRRRGAEQEEEEEAEEDVEREGARKRTRA